MPWAVSATTGSELNELTLGEFKAGITMRFDLPATMRAAAGPRA
jgi:hypothetical protein